MIVMRLSSLRAATKLLPSEIIQSNNCWVIFDRDYIHSHKHHNCDRASSQNSKYYVNPCLTWKNCGLKRPLNWAQQMWSSRRESSISKPSATHTSDIDLNKQQPASASNYAAEKARPPSSHQHLEGVKYTDAYRRLIKSHKENSSKIKVKSGRHVHIPSGDENTTELEFDSSADTNQNAISVSSELAKIQNKIKAEVDLSEERKYCSKADKQIKDASKRYFNLYRAR